MRVTNAPASRERRRRRLELASGFYGARSKQFRLATEAVNRAQRLATWHRKLRKREFRQLWINRINLAVRELGDVKVPNYSRFIEGLTKAGIIMNRKMLSELAINDAQGFKDIVAKAAAAL
ncbi:MAG: 50S ribosomal protein L20 [Kiritimatiellia bacterium]